jgi:hypothetical protein
MNAQREIQDTEIQDTAAEINVILQTAFDLLIQRRDRQYEDAIGPMDAEAEALRQEHVDIGDARVSLEQLLPAKSRVAQQQADVLLLAGKGEESKAKLAEAEEAAAAPAAMIDRQREISARIEAIEDEKKTIARSVFDPWYADAQKVIRAAETGLFVTLLDGIEDSMSDFQTRTGTTSPTGLAGGLFHSGHVVGLTADERSPEWQAASRWYGGRGK